MDHLGKGDSLGQAVGDPLVDDPEDLVLDRLPQVAVHQEDFFPVLGQGQGHIGNGGGLPFPRDAGGEANVFQVLTGSCKLEVGPDGPVGFRNGRLRVIFHNEFYFFHNFLRRPAQNPSSSGCLWSPASGITPRTGSSRYCSTSAAVRIFRFSRVRAMV